MAFNGPQEPKPYGFIPLPDWVDREKPAGHDSYRQGTLSGVIQGELVALTPVHVASGNIELTGSNDFPLVKAHFRFGDKLAIPGSSLKGTVRSIVEAITRSCLGVQSRFLKGKIPRQFEACRVQKGDKKPTLCPACRLFGAMGYQGQVHFTDACLLEGKSGIVLAPSLFAPRTRAPIYYRSGSVVGRKFYFHGQPAKGNVPLEVCTAGSRFRLKLDFTNLTESELGVLLTGLGQGEATFALKLGGAKPACYGSVEVKIESIETWDIANDSLSFDSSKSPTDAGKWIQSASALLELANLEKLDKILQIEKQRTCPTESY